MLSIPPELREQLLSFYPSSVRPEMEAALPDLELQAFRLGLEVLHAEKNGLSFFEAVRRQGDYPLMARCHFGLLDLLQYELTQELIAALRVAADRVRDWDGLEAVHRALACHAALHPTRPDGALSRFVLYEGIRLNVWLMSWDAPEVEALGCMVELDRDAELSLRSSLRDAELFHEDVRPLQVLVAEAAGQISARLRDARDELATAGADTLEYLARLCETAGLTRQLDAANAAVARNDYAELVQETHLGSLELAERHPHLFPSAEAVDMRRSRLRKSLTAPRVRGRNRMIDLLRESAPQELKS